MFKFLVVLCLVLVFFATAKLDRRKLIPILSKMPTKSLSEPEERIIGGVEIEPNSLPYQVALMLEKSNGNYFCGGSLISDQYVLTAGHCIEDVISVTAVLGAHNIFDETEETQTEVTSYDFFTHENYHPAELSNDIALVKFPNPIEFSDVIKPITLPTYSDVDKTYEGVTATLSGWGKISDSSSDITDILRATESIIMNNTECAEYYVNGIVKDTNVCTDSSTGHATCNGDSGGPLVYNGTLIGVVSVGAAAGCETIYPSVYTRVTEYLDWIAAYSNVKILT